MPGWLFLLCEDLYEACTCWKRKGSVSPPLLCPARSYLPELSAHVFCNTSYSALRKQIERQEGGSSALQKFCELGCELLYEVYWVRNNTMLSVLWTNTMPRSWRAPRRWEERQRATRERAGVGHALCCVQSRLTKYSVLLSIYDVIRPGAEPLFVQIRVALAYFVHVRRSPRHKSRAEPSRPTGPRQSPLVSSSPRACCVYDTAPPSPPKGRRRARAGAGAPSGAMRRTRPF